MSNWNSPRTFLIYSACHLACDAVLSQWNRPHGRMLQGVDREVVASESLSTIVGTAEAEAGGWLVADPNYFVC